MENNNLKQMEKPQFDVISVEKNDIITESVIEDTTQGGTGGNCLAKGTKITTADGSTKDIENIVEGDIVMTFDHKAAQFIGSEVIYAYKGDMPKCAFALCFDNGTKLYIIGKHDLFEKESCKYVTITDKNAQQFVGKHFYNAIEKCYVKLVSIIYQTQEVEYYEIYTKNNFNTIANGMLNVADDVDYLLNIYTFDKNLKADANALNEDVKKFGIFEYCSKFGFDKDEYNAWNMQYLNISVGKGLTSWAELYKQRIEYNKSSECA